MQQVIDFLPYLNASRIRAYEKRVSELLVSSHPCFVQDIKKNFIEWHEKVYATSTMK